MVKDPEKEVPLTGDCDSLEADILEGGLDSPFPNWLFFMGENDIVVSLTTNWRETWIVLPIGVHVAPGQSEARKLPSPLLAKLGEQTGWDCFFPCKAEMLQRNVAFGLGPTGLLCHHCYLLAGQKWAKEKGVPRAISVHTLIMLSSELSFSMAFLLAKRS